MSVIHGQTSVAYYGAEMEDHWRSECLKKHCSLIRVPIGFTVGEAHTTSDIRMAEYFLATNHQGIWGYWDPQFHQGIVLVKPQVDLNEVVKELSGSGLEADEHMVGVSTLN